jgi:hypothetical protein
MGANCFHEGDVSLSEKARAFRGDAPPKFIAHFAGKRLLHPPQAAVERKEGEFTC